MIEPLFHVRVHVHDHVRVVHGWDSILPVFFKVIPRVGNRAERIHYYFQVEDSSLVIGAGVSDKVANGFAYEKASVRVTTSLIVPGGALIREGPEGGEVEIYMRKGLHFNGHPPTPMHIRDARAYMGLATRREGDAMVLGSFGEFSTKGGGASIRLIVRIPKGTTYSTQEGLSGHNSRTMAGMDCFSLLGSPEFLKCYWYNNICPAEGWQVLTVLPDPEHVAAED